MYSEDLNAVYNWLKCHDGTRIGFKLVAPFTETKNPQMGSHRISVNMEYLFHS